jgi:hypothetical protein
LKISQVDGSLIFAWALGGTGADKIMEIAVLPQSEEVFFAIGGSSSTGITSSGSTMEFFVAKYATSTGQLLEYKTIPSLNGQKSILTSVKIQKNDYYGTHMHLLGHSTDPKFTFSSSYHSWFVTKVDLSLTDNNCFARVAAALPVQKNVITTALWTSLIPLPKTEEHVEIAISDKTGSFVPVYSMRNSIYFKLSTECVTSTRIPGVPDKSILAGDLLQLDSDDSYTIP